MATKRKLRLIPLTLLGLAVGAHAHLSKETPSPDRESVSPLWGNLHPGGRRVGFRTIFRYDGSRTWKSTRDYDKPFLPDLKGRPVQINLWYPASPDRQAAKMRFGDYVEQNAPKSFGAMNNVMRQRSRDDYSGSLPNAEVRALRSTRMNAYRDAPSAKGTFPAVLYFGGLNASINANFVLAEYLASQGYVVASISLLGPSDEQAFQSQTADDLESSVRDMEFAWS